MEIMIPPIYVVEIPGDDFLSENKYEVVDGKQRLSTITDFLKGKLRLQDKSLEYYKDLFGSKNFLEIKDSYPERITQMLSYVLDVYVITANSPEATKYDIFARLNKGAEKLKVNEIRRAIYHSDASKCVSEFVDEYISEKAETTKKAEYETIFSQNDIKRFEDYGRFYRSIAFYIKSDLEKRIVIDYNSRPREMINSVLQDLQEKKIAIDLHEVRIILKKTIKMMEILSKNKYKDYVIDACIPFVTRNWDLMNEKLHLIVEDQEFEDTFVKSPATTSNINKRLEIVCKYLQEDTYEDK